MNKNATALSQVDLVSGANKWICKLSSDRNFYVCNLRSLIDSKVTTYVDNPTIWVHLTPLKVIGFVWRACLDRIPSALALSRMGVPISSLNCYFCSTGLVESNHFLVGCHFANEVLSWIFQWCNIPAQNFGKVSELVAFAAD